MLKIGTLLCFLALLGNGTIDAKQVGVVAAENFYGILAQEIAGPYADVKTILNNPMQDPHLFSNSAKTDIAISHAEILIYNGLDYDPWVKQLVEAAGHHPSAIIVVADLLGRKEGDNPHIWYDPRTMPLFAQAFTEKMTVLVPEQQEYFSIRLKQFQESYRPLTQLIERIRTRFAGTAVLATEPLFNDMADALGLKMLGQGFQTSIMNDTEPSVKDIKEFESYLKEKKVKALIYNIQVTNAYTKKMIALAQQHGIPVVGMTETQPAGTTYVQWMTSQLESLEKAL